MRILLIFVILAPLSASATLGEKYARPAAAAAKFQSVSTARFVRHDQVQPKLTVHEFESNTGGSVFAVAWTGKTHPDLRSLLGSHFDAFERALKQARMIRRGRGPIQIEAEGLHLEMGGPPRAVYGRVWLVNQIPAGADPDEIH